MERNTIWNPLSTAAFGIFRFSTTLWGTVIPNCRCLLQVYILPRRLLSVKKMINLVNIYRQQWGFAGCKPWLNAFGSVSADSVCNPRQKCLQCRQYYTHVSGLQPSNIRNRSQYAAVRPIFVRFIVLSAAKSNIKWYNFPWETKLWILCMYTHCVDRIKAR